MIGGCQNIQFSPEMVLGTRRARVKDRKNARKKVPKSTKLAVSGLNLKISKKEKNFTKKNNFFTRFGFSELLYSSKSKKVTAKTKISKKRRNTHFGPPGLKNTVPQGEKRPVLARIMANRTRGSNFVQIGVVHFPGSLILRENDS